jgi:D-aspartate ligase
MKQFLEDIKFQGFCEFDLKYDYRDKKFKVLEINARQGRCSYYLTALGHNLVGVLIDDLIYNKKMDYKFLQDKALLSFVPKGVIKKYLVNEEYKKEVFKLWNKKVNPLVYKNDLNLKRILYLIKKHLRYYKEYKNSYWRP